MLNKLHRISACLIVTFVCVHIANHTLILDSVNAHIQTMETLRLFYRNPVFEALLTLCVVFQASSGVYLVWARRGQRTTLIEKAQAASGLYLAFFLLNHTAAVWFGRIVLQVDTNLYYGIAGLHVSPAYWFFIPYYFLAVAALFVHLACAFHWLNRHIMSIALRNTLAYSIMAVGAALSATLMAGFLGAFEPIEVPASYLAPFTG